MIPSERPACVGDRSLQRGPGWTPRTSLPGSSPVGSPSSKRHRAPLDCPSVSRGALQETATAGGKVGHDPRGSALQVLEVDDVEIGQVARGPASLGRASRSARPGDGSSDGRPIRSACLPRPASITSPQRQEAGGHAPVADLAAVCAGIRQSEHRHRRSDHLMDRIEVAVSEIEEGRVNELAPLALELHVIGVRHGDRCPSDEPLPRSTGCGPGRSWPDRRVCTCRRIGPRTRGRRRHPRPMVNAA